MSTTCPERGSDWGKEQGLNLFSQLARTMPQIALLSPMVMQNCLLIGRMQVACSGLTAEDLDGYPRSEQTWSIQLMIIRVKRIIR